MRDVKPMKHSDEVRTKGMEENSPCLSALTQHLDS